MAAFFIKRFLQVALLLAALTTGASAQSLIRDAEIEYALRKLAQPIFTAAGLNGNHIKILVINDSSLNAFVADNQHMFIHSGLILKLKSAEELQAVIAHEAAHIANGHISRRLSNMRSARTAAGLGILLSLAAGAASGNTTAGTGAAIGAMSTAQRVFLSHTRSEENSADQSGARFMARAGIDPQAMVKVLDLFRGQEAFSSTSRHIDPYALTHPMSRDRLRAVKGYAAAYGPQGKPDPNAGYWYARARGKLGAFIRNPNWGLREARKTSYKDVALMMKAVAYHQMPNVKKALKAVDALVKARPNDPYAHELRGQILLESRKFNAAAAAYAKAVSLAPREALILAGYGHALLAQGNVKKALPVLEKARARDPQDERMMRDLAMAYAKTGNNGMASLATAERYALRGRLKDAALHAKRAAGLLPRGSAGWNRAQDVLRAAQAVAKRR